MTDYRHIATVTVNKINILASWNFKHIVNLNKTRLYNAVDLKERFNRLEIRIPRGLWEYKNNATTKKGFDAVERQHKLRTEIGEKLKE